MTKLETIAIMAAGIYTVEWHQVRPSRENATYWAVDTAMQMYDYVEKKLTERGEIPEPAKFQPHDPGTVDDLPDWRPSIYDF